MAITKALSIRNPFATLIVSGRKTIETRSFTPGDWCVEPYGRFLVHAAKKFDATKHRDFGVMNLEDKFGDEPRGAIIGSVELIEIVEYTWLVDFINDIDRHLVAAEYSVKYGYVLVNPIRFDTPIPYKGQLGFFNVEECPNCHHITPQDKAFKNGYDRWRYELDDCGCLEAFHRCLVCEDVLSGYGGFGVAKCVEVEALGWEFIDQEDSIDVSAFCPRCAKLSPEERKAVTT